LPPDPQRDEPHQARKNGTPGIHGLQGDELRLIRQVIRENGERRAYLFVSERKAPLSIDGAQRLVERLGEAAKIGFPVHIHMLRHSAGAFTVTSMPVTCRVTGWRYNAPWEGGAGAVARPPWCGPHYGPI
jgi:integrase